MGLLFDRVCDLKNLHRAFRRVMGSRGAPGLDGQTIRKFAARLEDNLVRLHWDLRSGGYRPKPGRRVLIPKPGKDEKRPLVIPAVRDRVVQAALYEVLGPLFEPHFHEHSFGFRPGRGCLDALRMVIRLLDQGLRYVVDADIKACFDSIPHEPLLSQVSEKVCEYRILKLIRVFLEQGVMAEDGRVAYPEEGTPQGAIISPLLANVYLNPLDHRVAAAGHQMIRYADDFVILCRSREEAGQALDLVKAWMEEAGLSLHPHKTRIVDEREPGGFDFLGFHFVEGRREPRPENIRRLQEKLRLQTRRTDRRHPEEVIARVNQILKGWFQHFQLTSNPEPFLLMDGWTREHICNLQSLRQGRHKPRHQEHCTRKLFSLTKAFLSTRAIKYEEPGFESRLEGKCSGHGGP